MTVRGPRPDARWRDHAAMHASNASVSPSHTKHRSPHGGTAAGARSVKREFGHSSGRWKLIMCLPAYTDTIANGLFDFGPVDPATYRLRVVGKSGWRTSFPGSTVTNTATLDSNTAPAGDGGRPSTDTDPADVTVFTNSIAGFVYRDLNNNGVFDPGEPSAVSDIHGHYEINGLAPGPYTVRAVQPAG